MSVIYYQNGYYAGKRLYRYKNGCLVTSINQLNKIPVANWSPVSETLIRNVLLFPTLMMLRLCVIDYKVTDAIPIYPSIYV